MSQQVIQAADLSHIFRVLNDLSGGIASVDGRVGAVSQDLAVARNELALLQQSFSDFVAADSRAKQVQLAETRQVKVRQELETRFGYYAAVRRHATGILQAADTGLVRQETVACATEELMLSAPGYWLAPALVGLAAWVRDDRDLAERAAAEACRRDDEKTSLFLALVGRRAGRLPVTRGWLERYFGMQDPTRLDRQGVVLVDALASGVFGTEVRQTCSQRLAEWVQELGQRAGFLEEQRKQWQSALLSKVPSADYKGDYIYLARQSPTWPALNRSHNGAAGFAAIRDHLAGIFAGKIVPSPSLEAAVDELLAKLVTNFDDEELPLRRQDRLLQLVIDADGDKGAAEAKFKLEQVALEEEVSFTQLLTNAAMHPESSHASIATQRLAISVSRSWIKDAFGDLVASVRQGVPAKVEIKMGDWSGSTAAGENEAELGALLRAHIERKKEEEIAKLQFGPGHWAAAALGGALVLAGLFPGYWMLALIGAAIGIWAAVEHSRLKGKREEAGSRYVQIQADSAGILKACLAETVEWRRRQQQMDAVAAETEAFLERLAPSQHMRSDHDAARQVLAAGTSESA